MNNSQQFIEAGTLMLAGMVFVFVFLSILIVFINTVLAKLAVIFPDPIVVPSSRMSKKSNNKVEGKVSPAVVSAISGAVKCYRDTHGQAK